MQSLKKKRTKATDIQARKSKGNKTEVQIAIIVRSLSAKYRPDCYRRDKSVKFGTELP